MIADPHFDAALDQRLRDVGLDIGEANHEIRLQGENAVELGADEGRDARFLAARARRTHGKSRDADDPLFQPERVQNLGGLFGQTDDAPRITTVHVALKRTFGERTGGAVHNAVSHSRGLGKHVVRVEARSQNLRLIESGIAATGVAQAPLRDRRRT